MLSSSFVKSPHLCHLPLAFTAQSVSYIISTHMADQDRVNLFIYREVIPLLISRFHSEESWLECTKTSPACNGCYRILGFRFVSSLFLVHHSGSYSSVGKTTLLKHVLSVRENLKIAVAINDFAGHTDTDIIEEVLWSISLITLDF